LQAVLSQTVDEYLEELRAWADMVEYHGGSFSEHFELVPRLSDDGFERSDEERKRIAKDSTFAVAFIRRADQQRYGTLITSLTNSYAMGNEDYPRDITSAYGLLVSYKIRKNRRPRNVNNKARGGTESSGMIFAQQQAPVAGTDETMFPGITYYRCQATGHYANEYPNSGNRLPNTETTLLAQGGVNFIDPNWILLDS
jgi:hypothetical protein